MKKFWILVVVAMFGAACSTGGLSVEISTPDAPADAPADAPSPADAPADAPSPVDETPTEAPTTTSVPVPTATPEPTAVPEPTATTVPPTPTPTPTEIVLGDPISFLTVHVGQLELGGVGIGTEFLAAMPALNAWFGPSHDTGWIEGCPFDGPGNNERTLTWGGLSAHFYDFGTIQTFDYWTYRVDFPTGAAIPGGPRLDEVLLPNGHDMTAAFDTVVLADGGVPMIDEVFGMPIYSGFDFTLVGINGISDGISQVGTPYVGFCE